MNFRSVQEWSLHSDGMEELAEAWHRQSNGQEWSHDHCRQLLASRQLHRTVHSERVSSLQAALNDDLFTITTPRSNQIRYQRL